jgi:hypothetical protein
MIDESRFAEIESDELIDTLTRLWKVARAADQAELAHGAHCLAGSLATAGAACTCGLDELDAALFFLEERKPLKHIDTPTP